MTGRLVQVEDSHTTIKRVATQTGTESHVMLLVTRIKTPRLLKANSAVIRYRGNDQVVGVLLRGRNG